MQTQLIKTEITKQQVLHPYKYHFISLLHPYVIITKTHFIALAGPKLVQKFEKFEEITLNLNLW